MYRLFLGRISSLSQLALEPDLVRNAPQGPRRSVWLAGRAMLSRAVSPLPEIRYGEQGKPEFDATHGLWFNLSHSAGSIVLLLSDEGPVGCDIEALRPHASWQQLANAVFTSAEHALLEQEAPANRLRAFWRIWTRKEAMVKHSGGSVWQIVSVDSTAPLHRHVSDLQHEGLSIATCTSSPFSPAPDGIEWIIP
ncbi:4'-phosphopantetheinyl transferase AcpT [uncultured Pluralibacter sp.]|uniref:4'-phosphopantetheinyl transferase AcpT n=1 Tax=uncultured Pluralibacter sp. TaxID=1490864 RepID=UPI0026368289|nr:4'-phosphopantetheinyl transferase AcpT [uncultured Pluralibacter sp.]